MPSKLRILFRTPTDAKFIRGNTAIARLSQYISKECLLSMKMPPNWAKLNKYDRLLFLAKLLPKGFELFLIREPKHTRKNKSLFVQMLDQTFNVKRKEGNLLNQAFAVNPFAQGFPPHGIAYDDVVARVQPQARIRRRGV